MVVGGRSDVEDDGPDDADEMIDKAGGSIAHPGPPDRRHHGTVFYQDLPSMFWDEVAHDYQLGAIVDIAVGDGSLALTALPNRNTYTGFASTDDHRETIMARLIDLLSEGALKACDKWYGPKPGKYPHERLQEQQTIWRQGGRGPHEEHTKTT